MVNLDTHIPQLHRWLIAEIDAQVLGLRAHCASLTNADLPPDAREDAAFVTDAALSFEKVAHAMPTLANPLEALRQHAHDMRNPLSAVIGFSQYLRDTTGHPSAAAVYRVAHETLFTIDSLTYYARSKAGELEVPMHATRFDLVYLAARLSQQTALTMVLPDGALEVLGDRAQVGQVLMTLAQTANHIATDTALLLLRADTDERAHLTFRFPSTVDVAALAATFHPDWVVMPDEGKVWQVALCAVFPIVEGHGGSFEIVAVGEEVQFALALPLDVRDALNSAP